MLLQFIAIFADAVHCYVTNTKVVFAYLSSRVNRFYFGYSLHFSYKKGEEKCDAKHGFISETNYQLIGMTDRVQGWPQRER